MSIEGVTNGEKQFLPKVITGHERGLEFAASVMNQFSDVEDEEAVFMLALSLDHPEWEEELIGQVKKHKPHVSDPRGILTKLRGGFSEIDADIAASNQLDSWEHSIIRVESQVSEILEYFRPADGEFPKKVILVPAGSIIRNKNSGFAFHVGETAVIVSHSENVDNVGHEYLHGIINPLTEMLANSLPKEDIINLAAEKYKVGEMYGEHAESLLNEELIRTYNDVIRHGEEPTSLERFSQILDSLTEASFTNILNSEPETRTRLEQMTIHSLQEFRNRADEYFVKYVKNELRERIYAFYKEYERQKTQRVDLRFKDFFISNIKNFFALETRHLSSEK